MSCQNNSHLECLGQYKTANAILEKDGKLDDPSYMAGLNKSQFLEVHENVFPFSSNVASLEVLQLLSLFIAPSGLSDVGQQMFHFVPGTLDYQNNVNILRGPWCQSCIINDNIAGCTTDNNIAIFIFLKELLKYI